MGNPFPKLFFSGQMILGVHWQFRAKTMKFQVKKMIAVKIFRQQLGLSATGIIERLNSYEEDRTLSWSRDNYKRRETLTMQLYFLKK